MMIYCSAPLFVHAETITEPLYYSMNDMLSDISYSFSHYMCIKFETDESVYAQNDYKRFYTMCFLYTDEQYEDINITANGNTIKFSSTHISPYCYDRYHTAHIINGVYEHDHQYCSTSSAFREYSLYEIDFDNHTVSIWDSAGRKIRDNCLLVDYETNFDNFTPPDPLNLSISFIPDLTGTVTRSQSINGKDYTSNTLDLCISNNGENAQFAWFIVPHGDSVSFPTSLVLNSQGFIGQPTFAYVTDEWTGFQISGLQGNSVYSPCAWHTIPSGFQSQYYHVGWSQMDLKRNTSYDVVVYGCLNTLNDVSSKQVSADLTGAKEVYRSTFSITDPAEFNPNSDGYGVHPWNPDIDNSDLFNASSAYKDNNGNVVIKNQHNNNSNNIIGFDYLIPQNNTVNANAYFGSFFGFFRSIFSYFPAFMTIVSTGLITIFIIAVVKKVT